MSTKAKAKKATPAKTPAKPTAKATPPKPTSSKATLAETTELNINVVKTSTCRTLTGRSTLTYELGKDAAGDLYYQISGNTGGGFWSPEWIAWKAIEPLINRTHPVTSSPLKILFKGRSANNSAFILAVILAEKLLEVIPDKSRQFKVTGATPGEVIAATPDKKAAQAASKKATK